MKRECPECEGQMHYCDAECKIRGVGFHRANGTWWYCCLCDLYIDVSEPAQAAKPEEEEML